MKITLCISVPNGGEKLIALGARAAAALASGKHDIDIHYTCHSEEQRKLVEQENLALPVTAVHIIERAPNTFPHSNSVTHSRCVNALFRGADADIAVICDYDGAFAMRNWDEILVDTLVTRNIAFFGSPYSSKLAHPTTIGKNKFYGLKYQGKPNCIFLAYQPARIKQLTENLCDFSERFGSPDSLAMKLVSNPQESAIYGLPIGVFVSLDTGSFVPELIENHKLPSATLVRSTGTYQVLRIGANENVEAKPEGTLLPEEYLLDGKPYFIHYRKGARKSENLNYQLGYSHLDFIRDMDAHLQRLLAAGRH